MPDESTPPKGPFWLASDPDAKAPPKDQSRDPREQDLPNKDNAGRQQKPNNAEPTPGQGLRGTVGFDKYSDRGNDHDQSNDAEIEFSPDFDLTPEPAVHPDSWRAADTAWKPETGLTARHELTENDSEPAIEDCHIGKLDVYKDGELVASFDGEWTLESDDSEVKAYIDWMKEKWWHRNADFGQTRDNSPDNDPDL